MGLNLFHAELVPMNRFLLEEDTNHSSFNKVEVNQVLFCNKHSSKNTFVQKSEK